MIKTGEGLAEWGQKFIGCEYAWGMFFDAPLSEASIQAKKRQYLNIYDGNYVARLRAHIGEYAGDCSGVVKSYLMLNDAGKVAYSANLDYSAEALAKGSKPIATMPDIVGVLVFFPGHVGIYIGDGKVVEARSKDYGVVVTGVSSRPWRTWGYCPGVEYDKVEEQAQEPARPSVAVGGAVAVVQDWLNATYGAGLTVDNIAGALTKKAIIRSVQKETGVTQDGIFGTKSKAAFPVLRTGSQGDLVKLVAAMLICKAQPVRAGLTDTYSAVFEKDIRAYQFAQKITVDGLCGQETAYKLFR